MGRGENNEKLLGPETTYIIASMQGDGGATDQSAGSPFV
jgi:hypothetical protein